MTKATHTAPRQTAVSIAGVAVAVALLLVVTALGLGLVQETTVRSDAVDYWIVPQSADVSTMVVSAGEPQLGDVHRKSAELTRQKRIEYATPILVSVVQVESDGESEYVLGVGVIPSPHLDRVAGLPTAPLSIDDPYFANGSYDGEWTGEAVFSEGAADRLNVSTDANLTVRGATSGRGSQSFQATAVRPAAVESGLSGLPVMVVHLSELQAITGARSTDQADQILVKSNAAGLKPSLEDRFPDTTAVTRTGFTAENTVDSDLSLAMALAALVIAIVVGALFVATTQGLQVEADSEQLATLTAIGFSRRARAVLLMVQALALTLVGGALGIALAYVTTEVTNYAATRVVGPVPIATFHPLLVIYGFGVAAIIGILVAPYLLAMEYRSEGITEVMR